MSDLRSPAVAPIERRIDAVESVLAEHGHEPAAFVVEATRTAEEQWVPENGARVVAKAWVDAAFRAAPARRRPRRRRRARPRDAAHHRHLVVLENTADRAERHLLHALLVHGVHDHRPAARLVQGPRVPRPRRARVAHGAEGDGAGPAAPRSRSASGTPPRTRATWCCRCGRPAPTAGRRSGSPAIVTPGRDDRRRARLRPSDALMDGMHDLGGKQGFGPVRHAPDAPAFHADWEKRVNALYSLAVRRGIFNMDEYRHAIERMEPRHYLSASYYERSLTSLATLLVEKGLVTRAELERRAAGAFPLAAPSAPGRANVAGRERFAIGERVVVRADHVAGHVRMPGYIRGKRGVVVGESPPYPFPDARRTASRPTTSRPTTCASAATSCGRIGRRGVRPRRRVPELSRTRPGALSGEARARASLTRRAGPPCSAASRSAVRTRRAGPPVLTRGGAPVRVSGVAGFARRRSASRARPTCLVAAARGRGEQRLVDRRRAAPGCRRTARAASRSGASAALAASKRCSPNASRPCSSGAPIAARDRRRSSRCERSAAASDCATHARARARLAGAEQRHRRVRVVEERVAGARVVEGQPATSPRQRAPVSTPSSCRRQSSDAASTRCSVISVFSASR